MVWLGYVEANWKDTALEEPCREKVGRYTRGALSCGYNAKYPRCCPLILLASSNAWRNSERLGFPIFYMFTQRSVWLGTWDMRISESHVRELGQSNAKKCNSVPHSYNVAVIELSKNMTLGSHPLAILSGADRESHVFRSFTAQSQSSVHSTHCAPFISAAWISSATEIYQVEFN